MVDFLAFPVKHVEANVIFSRDGRVTAYYAIAGFNYDFLAEEDKTTPFINQLQHYQSQGQDVHHFSLPRSSNIHHITEETIALMEMKNKNYDYPLFEMGKNYIQQQTEALVQEDKASEKREYHNYIGIQLNKSKNKYPTGNRGTQWFGGLKAFIEGLNSPINQAIGLESNDILQSEMDAYLQQAKEMGSKLKRAFTANRRKQMGDAVRSLELEETLYLVESMYSATTNFKDVTPRSGYYPADKIEILLDGEKREAVRPHPEGYVALQDTYIDEINPQTLKLLRNDFGATSTLYVRCFVLTNFKHDEHEFPDNEWIYKLQKNLVFPFLYSGRMHHKHNTRVLKDLSNKKLEFDDQRDQAHKAGVNLDLSTARKEKGVIQLEDYFEKTGYPSYACSFIFRLQATSLEELDNRAEKFQEETRKYGLEVHAPFGEQPNLFMEMIPGATQHYQDYHLETDPRMLSGMMYGASSGLGDNRGFYIGDTMQEKPVYIYPELASKAFGGMATMVNSISMLVAGATGFGKSVLMNLILYLCVLTGGRGLVLDPKNDRKGWVKGLPFISKKYVKVWELNGSDVYKGILDPFRTAADKETGRSVATNIFSYLANVEIGSSKYNFLAEAFSHAAKQPSPCVGDAIAYLHALYEFNAKASAEDLTMPADVVTDLYKLIKTLDTFMNEPYVKLLVGHATDSQQSLAQDVPLQVISFENLTLPKSEKSPKDYSIHEKISTAILISITAFSHQFMMSGERTQLKVIVSDEADTIDKHDTGRDLNNTIVRRGRYFTTSLIKGAQNATDHGNDVANMGMKFCFALTKTEEAKEMLDYFDLPQTEENINRLKTLEQGTCLFQDIYGRTDVLRVNTVFHQVLDAFDTSTSTEEERKFEKEKKKILI